MTDEPLLVAGLDGCVVVGLDGCVVVGLVVLVVPERGVLFRFVVGRVVALALFPVASLLVARVLTRVGLVRLVVPTAERVVVRVVAAARPVTIRPFLSRVTRELATRDVFPTRVL